MLHINFALSNYYISLANCLRLRLRLSSAGKDVRITFMAQLPPRVPNMATNWPLFSPHKISSPMENMGGANNINPSWVDELLDFSAKRGSHRRSMSDSVAFLDIPMAEEECRRSSNPAGSGSGSGSGGGGVFEKFDDEQLMSMFNTDDIMGSGGPNMSCSNPSSPSDFNNMNEDHEKDQIINPSDHHLHQQQQQEIMKSEPEEVESSCKSDQGQMLAAQINGSMENSNDKIVDPKRIKRILANRQSAQRSRVRKLQYVSELERSVTSLQAEISVLSPRVAFLDHQRLILGVDNNVLKQRIAALAQDKIFKDAHQEALKREIERLRQVYNYQQNLKKKEINAASSSSSHHELKSQPSPLVNAFAEKEQLVN